MLEIVNSNSVPPRVDPPQKFTASKILAISKQSVARDPPEETANDTLLLTPKALATIPKQAVTQILSEPATTTNSQQSSAISEPGEAEFTPNQSDQSDAEKRRTKAFKAVEELLANERTFLTNISNMESVSFDFLKLLNFRNRKGQF